MIFGRLFERKYVDSDGVDSNQPENVVFDDASGRKMAADAGDTLRDNYWGRYVAFIRDARTRRQWVLRDPTGRLHCQSTQVHGLTIYFERLADLEALESVPLSINRHFLAGMVVFRNILSGETAYDNVSTVLPGERVEHGTTGAKKSFYWNALALADSNDCIQPRAAQQETRRIVTSTVHAWASCYDCLALQLSGGLDSSIVAACLATAPSKPEIVAINTCLDVETADERVFAREVAGRCGFELVENHASSSRMIDLSPRPERSVVPDPIDSGLAGWAEVCQLLNSKGCFGHFRGDGGDELFYRGGPLPDAVDHAFHHGFTKRLWSIAMNDAVIGRTSIWEALRLTVLHGVLRRPYEWRKHRSSHGASLFTPEILRDVLDDETHWHPLFRSQESFAPAKMLQAYSLLPYTMRTYTPPAVRDPPVVIQPLLSQPHMEFALRTPLHVLRTGARDRSLARAAFEDIVPSKVIHRRYKGLHTVATVRMVSEVMREAHALLMDGYLVKEGILDRTAVESLLARDGATAMPIAGVLEWCLEAEVWVRDAIAHEAAKKGWGGASEVAQVIEVP